MRKYATVRPLLARILWFEPFWVLAFGGPLLLPGRLLPLGWQPWLLVALFLFWPLRWLSVAQEAGVKAASRPQSPLSLALWLFLLWAPVGLAVAADRPTALVATGYLAWGVALYMALIHWPPSRRKPILVAALLLLFGAGLALIAPFIVEWKPAFRLFYLPVYRWFDAIHLARGESIHANILAGALTLMMPLLLALCLHPWSAELKQRAAQIGRPSAQRIRTYALVTHVLFALFFCYVTVLMVLTQSRGGYLAAGVMLPLTILLRWPRLWRFGPPLLVLSVLAVWWFGSATLANQLSKDGSLEGWQSRLAVWNAALVALGDFAFTGTGMGAFTTTLPLLYALPFDVRAFPHAHNLLLQVGLDLGLPGLIAYLALLINLFVMLIALLRRPHLPRLDRSLSAGAMAALAGMLIHGLVDAATWGVKLAFLPWLLFALITVLFGHTIAQTTWVQPRVDAESAN